MNGAVNRPPVGGGRKIALPVRCVNKVSKLQLEKDLMGRRGGMALFAPQSAQESPIKRTELAAFSVMRSIGVSGIASAIRSTSAIAKNVASQLVLDDCNIPFGFSLPPKSPDLNPPQTRLLGPFQCTAPRSDRSWLPRWWLVFVCGRSLGRVPHRIKPDMPLKLTGGGPLPRKTGRGWKGD